MDEIESLIVRRIAVEVKQGQRIRGIHGAIIEQPEAWLYAFGAL
jgi:hypothetical protein